MYERIIINIHFIKQTACNSFSIRSLTTSPHVSHLTEFLSYNSQDIMVRMGKNSTQYIVHCLILNYFNFNTTNK